MAVLALRAPRAGYECAGRSGATGIGDVPPRGLDCEISTSPAEMSISGEAAGDADRSVDGREGASLAASSMAAATVASSAQRAAVGEAEAGRAVCSSSDQLPTSSGWGG